MVRECSEEIEVEIEDVLIWEFVEQIYKDSQFWNSFKPIVEVPF